MLDSERDELLIELREMVARVDERTAITHKILFGNGQPGLVSAVAVLKDDMRRREEEAEELRNRVPSNKDKALVSSGVLTAIIIATLTAIKTVFFPNT